MATEQRTATLRVVVAATTDLTPATNVTVAEPVVQTADLSMFISDAPFIVIEPDRPKFAGLAVPDLTKTTASTVRSPTVDLEAQGIVSHDIVEILEGQNRGHYVVRAVDGNVLSLQQELLADDPVPAAAVIRAERGTTAYRTAAVVMSQPAFNQGFSVFGVTDVLIV